MLPHNDESRVCDDSRPGPDDQFTNHSASDQGAEQVQDSANPRRWQCSDVPIQLALSYGRDRRRRYDLWVVRRCVGCAEVHIHRGQAAGERRAPCGTRYWVRPVAADRRLVGGAAA